MSDQVTAGASALAALRAKEEIREVLFRYCRGVDRRDFELLRSAYHPDAEDDHGGYHGDVDGLIQWIRRRHEHVPQSMHFLGNCIIELAGNEARAETYCVVYQRIEGDDTDQAAQLGLASSGNQMALRCRYVDLFSQRDGAWRIARRTVVYESVTFEDSPGGSPFGAGLTVARRDRDDALYALG